MKDININKLSTQNRTDYVLHKARLAVSSAALLTPIIGDTFASILSLENKRSNPTTFSVLHSLATLNLKKYQNGIDQMHAIK